jgi:predicted benzoate:H+ symporter BenE
MCVQPMKSIAAVALATPSMTESQIMAAGIITSAMVTFLGFTNLLGMVERGIPSSVVRGLQLGAISPRP